MTALVSQRQGRGPRLAAKKTPPATPEELRAYIPYLVNRLSNRISADQNKFLAGDQLNNAAFRTLSILNIYEKLTVNEISVLAVIEQSSASRTIDQLLETGLVTRENGATDQRRREVALTRDGHALLRKIWPKIARRYENLTEGIAAEDIGLCAGVLSRMIDNVRKHQL
ncbi:MAG: MarR family winged helix-turn-helix transcriptional regulator [Rhodoblastus sp.]